MIVYVGDMCSGQDFVVTLQKIRNQPFGGVPGNKFCTVAEVVAYSKFKGHKPATLLKMNFLQVFLHEFQGF